MSAETSSVAQSECVAGVGIANLPEETVVVVMQQFRRREKGEEHIPGGAVVQPVFKKAEASKGKTRNAVVLSQCLKPSLAV